MFMSPFLQFLFINALGGFIVGLFAGAGYILFCADVGLFEGQPLATAMLLWGFGASFAMGAVCTGLALLPYQ